MQKNFSTREIFRKIVNFEESPRTMKWEFGYWGDTVIRWYEEGLTSRNNLTGKQAADLGAAIPGPALPSQYIKPEDATIDADIAQDIKHYFKFDSGLYSVPYNYFYYPVFEDIIIEEDERYIVKYNELNIKTKELKDKSSMPLWLEFPVKNRTDWEKIKEERLRFDSINDRFIGDKAGFYSEAKNRDYILGIFGGDIGFFGSLRFLMGEERLFMAYYDDPSLVKDMVSHLCDIWLIMAEELTSKIDFDVAYFWEDMSGKNGSLISPSTFREFMSPYYKKITDFLKSKNINKCFVDSDGYVGELIPLFLEVGVNMLYPFERQANNDLVNYRKKYPDLVMLGGFDKNTLYKGKEAIDAELEITKWLISQGGYIPFCDHLVPPNASWENFKYYRNKLNKIIDGS